MGTLTNENPTPLDPDGWRLTFSDGFDGAYLDRGAWPILFNGARYWNNAFDWRAENVVVWDGQLTVSSIASPSGWTGGGLNMGWNGQLYGRWEVRARLDEGKGTSGAILLWPTDGGHPPEIDLMESPDPGRTTTYVTLHGEGGTEGRAVASDASEWHTYAVDWLPDRVTFYIDGVEQLTTTERVPDQPMALGFMSFVAAANEKWFGGGPDASTPGVVSLHVDWARIWTPEAFYPGESPALHFREAGESSWAEAADRMRSGVRSIGEERYAASWNSGEWGDVTALSLDSGRPWVPGTADRLLFANVEEVSLALQKAPMGLDVKVIGAATGVLVAGTGDDRVTWLAHADAASRQTPTGIALGEGNDTLLVTTPASSDLWQPFAWGGRWNGAYDGGLSRVHASGNEGNDRIEVQGQVLLVANGGAGDDTIIGGGGADTLRGAEGADDLTGGGGANTFFWQPGEGGDVVRDFKPGVDRLALSGMDPALATTQAAPDGLSVAYGGEVLAVLRGVNALQPGDMVFG
ncbi:MAG TPA: family 16 glycosylhydrolase [Falsiroseomonas sp.]|nr:family 16 glycosylhydrolase [Falsiroseomonas sp.]